MLILIMGSKTRFQNKWVGTRSFLYDARRLFTAAFPSPSRLDAFAVAVGGAPNWYHTAIQATQAAGIDFNAPFSLLATLLVAPIAWTSLQWATYSAEQNGEIKDARSFKNQAIILVGSLSVTGILLALLAAALEHAVGTEFLYVAGAGYWSKVSEATINGFWLWPNMIAVALTASPIVVILIAIGYILNSHQIVHNCYIGVTRCMVAMSLDRLLPEWVTRERQIPHARQRAWLFPGEHSGNFVV
jgi:hypothetical protein